MFRTHLVERIYTALNQTPIGNAASDEQVKAAASPTTRFSSVDLNERIDRAVLKIITSCKAQHIPYYLSSFDVASGSVLSADLVRVMMGRVFVQNGSDWVRATFRDPDAFRVSSSSGRAGTPDYPVFTIDGGVIRSAPATNVRYNAIVKKGSGAEINLDQRFERAIIYDVVASCAETENNANLSAYASAVVDDELSAFLVTSRILTNDTNDVEVDVE